MTNVTVIKAASLTGKSTQTIYRHINLGKLSRATDGTLDVAELLRVYGAFKSQHVNIDTPMLQTDSNNEWLMFQIEKMQEQIEFMRETTQTLLQRLDSSDQERQKLLNMLTHQSNATEEQQNSDKPVSKLWLKLFGKKGKTASHLSRDKIRARLPYFSIMS